MLKTSRYIVQISFLLILFIILPTVTLRGVQPSRQSGTGTYSTSSGGQYKTLGYSFVIGDFTTSVSLSDDAVIKSFESSSPEYMQGFNVITLTGSERHATGSYYVRRADGSYTWYNFRIRLNPANFDKNNTKVGRSLIDNLYNEGNINKSDLTQTLSSGGTGWVNQIIAGRRYLTSDNFSVMYKNKLWSNGKNNYSIPGRVYVTDSIKDSFTWTDYTYNLFPSFYDNPVVIPPVVEVDDSPPVHIEHALGSYKYKNGNDYWTTPNDTVTIDLRQRDVDSGNKHQYLRLTATGEDIRKRHDFYDGVTDINSVGTGYTSSYLSIDAAKRLENTTYGKVRWNVTPKRHGDAYDIRYYYEDENSNAIGYHDTYMNLKVDGVAPTHNAPSVSNTRYQNGNTYWVRPDDIFSVQMSSYEKLSGHYRSYMRLLGDGNDNRAYHQWNTSHTDYTIFNEGEYTEFVGGDSPYYGWTAKYKFDIKAKSNAHGRTFTIYTAYRDNVMNFRDYIDSEKKIAVDGEGPSVSFSPYSEAWTNNDVSVEASITDDDSGINRIRYKVYHDGTWSGYSDWMSASSEDFSFTENGVHRIYLEAEDNVGNKTTAYSGYYHVDKTDPIFTANAITGYDYKDGNNYWIKPSASLNIRFRGYDYRSRITLSYLRLYGTSEVRSQHKWLESSTHLNNYMTSPYVTVNAVSESYESADDRYREVTFNTSFHTHGQYYTVYSLKRDAATNWSDNYVWYNTGKVIRTDGLPPVSYTHLTLPTNREV